MEYRCGVWGVAYPYGVIPVVGTLPSRRAHTLRVSQSFGAQRQVGKVTNPLVVIHQLRDPHKWEVTHVTWSATYWDVNVSIDETARGIRCFFLLHFACCMGSFNNYVIYFWPFFYSPPSPSNRKHAVIFCWTPPPRHGYVILSSSALQNFCCILGPSVCQLTRTFSF